LPYSYDNYSHTVSIITNSMSLPTNIAHLQIY